MSGEDEFLQKMAKVIWQNRWGRFSAFDTWLDNHLCPKGAAAFAREHCVFARHFPRWFGAIIASCPEMDARQYMIENMYVEEVRDPTIETGHYESMVDFAVGLGEDRDFIQTYKGAIYTRLAIAYWERASRSWPWLEGFAAVAGLEAARGPQVKAMGRTRPMTRSVWEPLGLDDKAMAHWSAGDEADLPEGGHGDMTLRIMAKYSDTPAKQERVLEILEESMQVRWYHFDQIGRDALLASGVAPDVVSAA